ncbi:MAG: ATPase [Sphingomonadaceae bacterium]
MTGGSRIIAFGGAEGHSGTTGETVEELAEAQVAEAGEALDEPGQEPEYVEEWYEEPAPKTGLPGWVPASVAIVLALAWTGFFGWAQRGEITGGASPEVWTGLVVNWSVPLLLIAVLWLVAMRNSTREARRFGDAAGLLSAESARLEERMHTVNRELSLAREFIAAQSRDLDAIGRIAVERLTTNAQKLDALVAENDEKVERLGTVSDTAVSNMEKLREQLPVIASSTKDVTNNIGNAGRTAHAQIEEMVRGFKRINEFGKASETQVHSLREAVSETLERLGDQADRLEELASTRFAAIDGKALELRTQLEEREIEALASIRNRVSVLAEELEATGRSLSAREDEALQTVQARLSSLRDEGGTIARDLREGEDRALERWRGALSGLEEERSIFFAKVEEAENTAIENARTRLDAIAEETAAIEQGLAERAEKLRGELEDQRARFRSAESEAMSALDGQLAAIEAKLAERMDAHEARNNAIAGHTAAISGKLYDTASQLDAIAGKSDEASQRIAATLREISSNVAETQTSLSNAESELSRLTDGSVRLLELIQASAVHSREALPLAMADSETKLVDLEQRVQALAQSVTAATGNGETLFDKIEASDTALKSLLIQIEERQSALQRQGAAHRETLSSLARALTALEEQGDKVSKKARAELSASITKLELSAREAVESIESKGAAGINALAEKLGEASAEAIEKAVQERASDAAAQLEKAAADAAGLSREATIQLRDQLGKVAELVANLEQRVTYARERAEEQVDNDFSRRVALITESLNSNAIDIAKALSTDVSDTAWEGYLRGDRGIFTRRAVSLLDANDTKAIHQIFERDNDFREHVSRYIHDFEAILREVLSTRDGNALGVTLLSSDMGKLYVALAQAIDRLRS